VDACQKTALKAAYADSMNQPQSRQMAASDTQNQHFVQLAWRLLQAGDIAQAVTLFSGLLSRPACRMDASVGLAQAALAQGQQEQALAWAQQAASHPTASVQAHVMLCRIWRQMGQSSKAAEHCKHVLTAQPTSMDLWVVLALSLKECGQSGMAEEACRHALSLAPDDVMVNQNLGNLLQARGELIGARDCYVRVLQSSPGHVPASFELAQLARKFGAFDQARTLYRQVLAAKPDLVQAWRAMADLEAGAGQIDPACAALTQLTRLQPADAGPWLDLARLKALSHPMEAVLLAERGIELAPQEARGHYLLALSRRSLHQSKASHEASVRAHALAQDAVMKAESLYLQALALLDMGQLEDATHAAVQLQALASDAHQRAVANDVQASIALLMGDVDRAIGLYQASIELVPDRIEPRTSLCAALLYDDSMSPAEQCEHVKDLVLPFAPYRPNAYFANDRRLDRPLKVGYLSGDLRQHSCASFIEPLWRFHHRAQFHITAYHTHGGGDAVTEKLKSLCDRWVDVAHLDDAALRDQIRADEIDILIELSGFTVGGRLLALAAGAAPVQVSWLGYLGSSGLPGLQHRLTDAWVNPPHLDLAMTEQAVRLPRPYLCFQPDERAPEPVAPPMLRSGPPTFGSFNVLHKISPACIRLWSEVLHAVPSSKLLLKTRALGSPMAQERLLSKFEQHGIDRNRIECLAWVEGQGHHLNLYGRIDVALDTWPYNGVTTTCEALWMGVPVVSRVGEVTVSRQGLTLLTAVGLTVLCANTDQDYVQACVRLVTDPQALAEMRAGLRAEMRGSALLDAKGFAESTELALRQLWRHWALGR